MVYRNRGLTLVEILVSITITIIVMVYGLGFFTAAWRFQTEAVSYGIVLNKAEAMIEEMKYKIYEDPHTLNSSDRYYVQIPSSKTVEITKIVTIEPVLGAYSFCHQINVLATWPVKNPDGTDLNVNYRNKISLKTHITVPYGK